MKMREGTPPAFSLSSQKLGNRVPRDADRPANADAPELSTADDTVGRRAADAKCLPSLGNRENERKLTIFARRNFIRHCAAPFRTRFFPEDKTINIFVITKVLPPVHVFRVALRQRFLRPAACSFVGLDFFELVIREKALQADSLILIMHNSCTGMADNDNVVTPHFKHPPQICPQRSKGGGRKSFR